MIKELIRKKLDRYRFHLFPWVKLYLLQHNFLERKPEVFLYQKHITDMSFLMRENKTEFLSKLGEIMSEEIYTQVQLATRYQYLPQVDTLALIKPAITGDSQCFVLTITACYAPRNYLLLKGTQALIRGLARETGKMVG